MGENTEKVGSKEFFSQILKDFKTPYEQSLKYDNIFVRDSTYQEFNKTSFILAKQLLAMKKEYGLSIARAACDYLVTREIETNPGHEEYIINMYSSLDWGDIGESNTGSIVGHEMVGAYHRYLATHAESSSKRAQHYIQSLAYLSPVLGGFNRYVGEVRRSFQAH